MARATGSTLAGRSTPSSNTLGADTSTRPRCSLNRVPALSDQVLLASAGAPGYSYQAYPTVKYNVLLSRGFYLSSRSIPLQRSGAFA